MVGKSGSKRVVAVVAHPDDEVLGCGGVLANHIDRGDSVAIIFLSSGVGARQTPTPDIADGASESTADVSAEVAARQQSARDAAACLGRAQLHFLDLPDNRFDQLPLLEVIQQFEALLLSLNPNIVYTHFSADLNRDHRITNQATLTILRPMPSSELEAIYTFEVLSSTHWQSQQSPPFVPNVFVDIESTLAKKLDALRAYGTEMREAPHARSCEAIEALAYYRGHTVGLVAAEAFMLERTIIRA